MTSGNLTDEPIAIDNDEALARLAPIADAFLLHDRAILSRYDDSVSCVSSATASSWCGAAAGTRPSRSRSRSTTDTDILAAGPEQKNTFTLLTGGYAFVSQHIGDLENAETLASYATTIELYERLFRIDPEIVAFDLHPEYLSTKWALELSATQGRRPAPPRAHRERDRRARHRREGRRRRLRRHGLRRGRPHLGRRGARRRLGGLRALRAPADVPMPGGAARSAARRGWRWARWRPSGCSITPASLRSDLGLPTDEEATLLRMIERGVNSPLTSSMGRLFDSVAAITGVADDARYEGEAAILLEAAADLQRRGTYEFGHLAASPQMVRPPRIRYRSSSTHARALGDSR